MNEYFSHDYNARNDIKIKKMFMGEGVSGIGIYWCLVEMLYENNGYLNLEDIPAIAYDLRTKEDKIHNLINKYDLFCTNEKQFFSNSILKRLDIRNEKSEMARKSAVARWENDKKKQAKMRTHSECNANAKQTECDSNAIKINKMKKNYIKENYIKNESILNKNIISKQASNIKKEEESNNVRVCENFEIQDYDDLLDDFGVFGEYRNAIFRFIGHLKINFNLVMLNSRLENLIVKLDRCQDDRQKVKMIDDAIIKGYKRLEIEE